MDDYSRINCLSILITTFSVVSLSSLNAIAGCIPESSPTIAIKYGKKKKILTEEQILDLKDKI